MQESQHSTEDAGPRAQAPPNPMKLGFWRGLYGAHLRPSVKHVHVSYSTRHHSTGSCPMRL